MRDNLDQRACELAVYLLAHRATVRSTAQHFGVCKSTVHKDLTERLAHVNRSLYDQVQTLLAQNKAERHIRGGNATKRKYGK